MKDSSVSSLGMLDEEVFSPVFIIIGEAKCNGKKHEPSTKIRRRRIEFYN